MLGVRMFCGMLCDPFELVKVVTGVHGAARVTNPEVLGFEPDAGVVGGKVGILKDSCVVAGV